MTVTYTKPNGGPNISKRLQESDKEKRIRKRNVFHLLTTNQLRRPWNVISLIAISPKISGEKLYPICGEAVETY